MMKTVTWVKCHGDVWCHLEWVDLRRVSATGVYIIWHGGPQPRVVRIGQGDIATRLAAHRNDPQILIYKKDGLMVTWAEVSAAQIDGVERYLANQWVPLIGDAFPAVLSIRHSRQDPLPNRAALNVAARKQFVSTHRRHRPGIDVAVPLQEQIGCAPDVGVVDHPVSLIEVFNAFKHAGSD
jgi:hypothetical protein